MQAIMENEQSEYVIETPLGKAVAAYNQEALVSLRFVDGTEESFEAVNKLHDDLIKQLNAYFTGESTSFDFPLAPKGTDFQQRVWRLLQEIPYGESMSYQSLSKEYGDEKAIRAIAAANGSNPIMILIPCHRVIGSDGSLTGYAGGLWRKEALLDLERGVQRLF
jgi:methylated-DNA-[protein]-cysteine S-methyltransferase